MNDLTLAVGDHTLAADWVEENPDTRAAIETALPVSGEATRWGEELYFSIPVDVPAETTTEEVPVGGVAYWPQGNALCLFWGPTPASHDDEPRAAGPVSLVAVLEDVGPLLSLEENTRVRVERA